MLRTLLAKKVLSYGNAALAVFLAGYVVVQLVSLGGGGAGGEAIQEASYKPPKIDIPSVGSRKLYDPIVEGGLLGKDIPQKTKPKKDKPKNDKPKEPAAPVPTTLNLKLIGTVVSYDADPFGAAIITNGSGATDKRTYFTGDEVQDEVFVKEIHRAKVLLDNRRANRLEELQLESGGDGFRPVSRGRSASASVPANREDLAARIRATRAAVQGSNRIFTFNRQEIITELEEKYDDLASSVDVELVTDANGNVDGIKANNLSRTPLAQKFGFQDGDVITSVNGQRVDSMDRVYEIVDRNQNATTFRVQLKRGGRPQTFTYHLR